ncbi:DegT/DnrJ/EryC1/StrS family aminotransferase [Ralstonia sp.]|uniref:DegT/DnrJ/EryC1/StrS family aminotransferase n=1 Tax=Ralstonia sp. TaxID=54061 RepID=UPI00257E65CF|nr:DegT/DnrJ/EryC1/StrS family aminotransferase [Ralstonia sp.]
MPALEEVLYGGFVAEGVQVYEFERRFAEQFGLSNALGMSSGTGALHVALLMSGVKPGSEVISTSMTAEPTNTSILQCGATPVFADIEADSGNLDPASVEAAITPRTRAIVVVHYAGFPAKLDELRAIADRHRLSLIEDAAHALGARWGTRGIGSVGDFGIFSLQAIKHMTTVDGGVLTMRDSSRLDEARRLRWFGLAKGVARTEVDIKVAGFKYNMHNVAATIGLAQLDHIGNLIDRHIENGRFFDERLSRIPGLAVTRFPAAAEPSYWLYTVLSDDSDDVQRRLAEIGVQASKLHRPNHLHTVFSAGNRALPSLERYYRQLTHLPCGWWVSDEVRERVVDTLAQG